MYSAGLSMFMDICIMHILIIAATHDEIQEASVFFEEKKYKKEDLKIQIAVTGIGLVSTTYMLGRHINAHRPDIIIQAGIAGSFLKDKSNAIVVVNKESLADMGVQEDGLFKSIFDLRLAGKNDPPFTNGYLVNPYQKLLSLTGFEQAIAISVNEITTEKNKIEWYHQNFAPVIESMEGAALHYVCLQEKIPFLQIRSVSNYIGEREKSKWTIKQAITILNEQLILLTNKLSASDATYFRI